MRCPASFFKRAVQILEYCEQSRRLLWGKRRSAAGGGWSEALSGQRSKKSSSARCDDFFVNRNPAAKPRMPKAEKDHTADIVACCVVFLLAPLEDVTQKLSLFSIIPK